MKKRLGIAIAVLSYTLALLSGATHAADKPIRLVIFAAGGPVDFVARQFAERLSKTIGTDVIVEAKPGANGIIAAQNVISSEPDGTTLFFSSSGLFTISPIFQKLPFDIDRDLVPVSRIVINASAVAIDANIPAKTVSEFVAYAKAKKQTIDFGSPGVGNITQLWIEQFADATGLPLMAVPYKGIAPVMVDVMGGRQQARLATYRPFYLTSILGACESLAWWARHAILLYRIFKPFTNKAIKASMPYLGMVCSHQAKRQPILFKS